MALAHAVRDADSDEAYEGSRAFTVRTPINPGQLDAEITKAMGWKNQAGLIVEGDPTTASADDPVRVWVVRGEVDEKKFTDVVKAHKPNAAHVVDTDVEALKAKAKAGEPLSAHEQTALLAALLD